MLVLALVFDDPGTFLDGQAAAALAATMLKAVSVGAVFSVVGAATADSVFYGIDCKSLPTQSHDST